MHSNHRQELSGTRGPDDFCKSILDGGQTRHFSHANRNTTDSSPCVMQNGRPFNVTYYRPLSDVLRTRITERRGEGEALCDDVMVVVDGETKER